MLHELRVAFRFFVQILWFILQCRFWNSVNPVSKGRYCSSCAVLCTSPSEVLTQVQSKARLPKRPDGSSRRFGHWPRHTSGRSSCSTQNCSWQSISKTFLHLLAEYGLCNPTLGSTVVSWGYQSDELRQQCRKVQTSNAVWEISMWASPHQVPRIGHRRPFEV